MRVYFVAVVLAQMAFVLCDIPIERYAEIHVLCAKKSGVEEAVIQRAQQGDFENSLPLKQYIVCLMDEEKCLKDGKVDEELTVEAVPVAYRGEFEKPIRDCYKEIASESDLTEACYKMVHCIHSKTMDKFFLP